MLFEERLRAESFGAVAELDDHSRPSYPVALVDFLLADGAQRILDVGCGTGIAGALLAARGRTVLGVEIDARMAAVARARGLEVEVAPFERWEASGRRFDLVSCAQAWHWIEPEAGAANAAAVLSEGGQIGIFWNLGDPPAHIAERLAPIYERLGPGVENYSVLLGNRQARAETTLTNIAGSGHFTDAQVHTFPWHQRYDTASWLAHLQTHSDHQALPPAQLKQLLVAVGGAIDAAGGSFEMPYTVVLVSARRN